MNRPLTEDIADIWYSETHGGTGEPEYEIEDDDECEFDDME